jgi:putative endonuclease
VTAKRDLGDFGERVARHHLEAAGFVVLGTNVRVPSGEVDIVGRDGSDGDLVFVEVRTRRAGAGSAAETVTPVKLLRMWRCAMDYCEQQAQDPDFVRLDLVTLDLDASGAVVAIDRIRGLELPPVD